MNKLHTLGATAQLIRSGRPLLLAGDEALLADLPNGNWIGGTIPYFMTSNGGLQTAERVFVTELPDSAAAMIRRYDASSLPRLAADHPGHGFTILLIPAFSESHSAYAKNALYYPGIFDRPVVGWISGVAVDDIGKVRPKVFDGTAGAGSADAAVALHVGLPEQDQVSVDIINLFEPGGGDTISFLEPSFSVTDALVDGKVTNLASYMSAKEVDIRLPLVADYSGAKVNISIQKVDPYHGVVEFYAPVFPDLDYRLAAPIGDYVAGFAAAMGGVATVPTFSCNCILNYIYAGLHGRSTGRFVGPMTFGEIAYMLLNQTAVHLSVNRGSADGGVVTR